MYKMSITLESLWGKITDEVSADNSGPAKIFLNGVKPVSLEDKTLIVSAANDYVFSYFFKEKNRFEAIINKVIKEADAELNYKAIVRKVDVSVKKAVKPVQPSLPTFAEEDKEDQNTQKATTVKHNDMLNAKYTFDSFVVGKSNEFAYALSQAVTKNPGTRNPLFIYGGVGLGKTHLIQAIGHEMIKNDPKAKVVYVSSEAFTNEFIDSLSKKKIEEFRKKYRKIDLLLIDDVQFFAKKEQTQEEFFHTFNELYQQKKQIVITSDKNPSEIPDVDERLASRFSSGVMADIQSPSLEERTAILKNCAKNSMVEISDEVIMYLARGVTSNIRALEGAFNTVCSYSFVMNKPIDKDMVDQVLKTMLRETAGGKIGISYIIKRVAEFYDVSEAEIIGKRRSAELVLPRQVAMRLSQILTDSSLNQIGDKFGGRDHTTVMHACDKINKMIKNDKNFADEFERVKRFVDPNKE